MTWMSPWMVAVRLLGLEPNHTGYQPMPVNPTSQTQ